MCVCVCVCVCACACLSVCACVCVCVMKSVNSKFDQIGTWTAELAALERLEKAP